MGRQHLVRELMKVIDVAAVVETGTYRGTTTEFLWQITGKTVYSAESEPRYYEYARKRFSQNASVILSLSDSRQFLQDLAADVAVPKEDVFFYLDAHWGPDLPLREELQLITRHWRNCIIMIDDFEVPDDPGYGFDDYGEGRSLTAGYIPHSKIRQGEVLYPSLPSSLETGARRGCAMLVESERASVLLSKLPLRTLN
jgi:hypothetical protein